MIEQAFRILILVWGRPGLSKILGILSFTEILPILVQDPTGADWDYGSFNKRFILSS